MRRLSCRAMKRMTVLIALTMVSVAVPNAAIASPTVDHTIADVAEAVDAAAVEVGVDLDDANTLSDDISTYELDVELPDADGDPAVLETVHGEVSLEVPGEGKPTALVEGVFLKGAADYTGLVMEPVPDGVRASVYLAERQAPERYEFQVGGDAARLELNPDGGASAIDSNGVELAVFDPPWAVDVAGRQVPTHYEIRDGRTLVQVVDHDGGEWTYPIVADPTANGVKYVSVPKGYAYNPKVKKQPSLHDYCTKSPDSYLKANFRGPCARHDMCIKKAIDNKKRNPYPARVVCDAKLWRDLASNCRYTYSWKSPFRYNCLQVANNYFGVVSAKALYEMKRWRKS